LLNAITEQWVEYLTKVEALRVSIGLEAYAQRDPLVQYKGQASQMFQNLMGDIRAGVIGRIFLYQPRPAAVTVTPQPTLPAESPATAQKPVQQVEKKRKRHKKH
jgi:preprotein translocase subunit SecA